MSDANSEVDSPEFVAHLAGLYRDAARLARSAQTISRSTEQRLEAIRRNGFLRLAEIGEGLLAVQQQRPDEFEEWFAMHKSYLGFSLSTGRRCKAAARLVLEHGLEEAITLTLTAADRGRPEPFFSLRLSMGPGEVPPDQIAGWLDRIRPAVEFYHALEERAAATL
jgi:hypothetical protein